MTILKTLKLIDEEKHIHRWWQHSAIDVVTEPRLARVMLGETTKLMECEWEQVNHKQETESLAQTAFWIIKPRILGW